MKETKPKETKVLVGHAKFANYAGKPTGQGARIYGALLKLNGGATVEQLTTAVAKLGFKFKGKATAESCARAWARNFVNMGIANWKGEELHKLRAKEFKPAAVAKA